MENDFEKNIFSQENGEESLTESVNDVENSEPVLINNFEEQGEFQKESAEINDVAEEDTKEPIFSQQTDNNPTQDIYASRMPEFNVTHTVKKQKRIWPRVVALSLLAGILFGTSFGFMSGLANRFLLKNVKVEPTKVTLNKSDEDVSGISNVSMIAQECMPSIVAITNRGVSDVMTFFGTYSQESTSSGSGIIIGQNDTELLIVTNYHVVANSKELSVVFSPVENQLEQQAEEGKDNIKNSDIPNAVVKGYDSNKDLAVIAVKLEDISSEILSQIKIATIGDSSTLKPGDQVIAIGNALGYGQSVTTGIISAVNRNITMESADGNSIVTNTFIQTDAAINSGNSGGALLDMAGNLIGINSVKIATTGVEGMGYAIPISDVEEIIDGLMIQQTRDVVDEAKQGFLGITGTNVSSNNNSAFGIPVGVFVNSVVEGLAAETAGIKKGYVIVKFDGYSITTIEQLQDRLRYYSEGETVSVVAMVPEDGSYVEKEFKVKLSNRSENIDE